MKKNHHSYSKCTEDERRKLTKDYKRIKEYEDYYLYARYDQNNNFLYRECFSKFDIDGVKKQDKVINARFKIGR